ncbi:unnamed protein product [Meganyctiphanes norvegica]|uniref:Selenocysteine-specific elongation factor n=1 Tax=Meganyctiphanes norvegica TaxID=48144 RepID=A0AAV2SJ98_MEGNR
MSGILNFNVGVLGHVDSGKTSLAKALSTVASTACFDKNPQSKERGITIDLGFSSFVVDAPDHVKSSTIEKVQFTLVDCPGHASLIRTIIGGAQIIDAMILVIDITKGMQTQTAECLIIGEILCKTFLVVLNKVDMIPKEKQKNTIEKMTKRIHLTLQNTKFAGAKVVIVAAKPGGPEAADTESIGVKELMESMKDFVYIPERNIEGKLLFSVDHCFSIRGQGTVMTGTMLQGSVSINDNIEIPTLKVIKKVKSMQMFKKPVEKAVQGDRLGICVTQFDPKQLERGIVGSPEYIQIAFGTLALVEKINYYKLPVETKAKFHISIGHETVMAKVTFFGSEEVVSSENEFKFEQEYKHQSELIDLKKLDEDAEYKPVQQYALLEFEKPIHVIANSILIGSKLDMDVHTSMCRLAFKGKLLTTFNEKNYNETQLPKLKVFKNKSKEGIVERMSNDSEVIVRNLLKKDTNIQLFVGLKVKLSSGEEGMIDGSFGQSGKIKVRISNGLNENTQTVLKKISGGKKKGKGGQENESPQQEHTEAIKVVLNFKKYTFSTDKKMIQS